MFLGDYLFAPQFLRRHAARGWSWKIPVMDIRVRCSIREYWGMYVIYRTDSPPDFDVHLHSILLVTALAVRVFFNPPFKGCRSSSTCPFVISMIVAVDSSGEAVG
jgi:hypothetical protein